MLDQAARYPVKSRSMATWANGMMRRILAALTVVCLGAQAEANRLQEKHHEYLTSNLLAIYYHELGHALIDVMKLPIFGQEEDAADVLSVFLIDALWDGDRAIQMAYHTADGFLGVADDNADSEPIYWGVHGLDLQRYYTFVCLFYGADPDARKRMADDLKLPEYRQRTCRNEYEQARDSWGAVIGRLKENGPGRSIRLLSDHRVDEFGRFTAEVMAAEIAQMNKDLSLPKRILVRVEECGTVNAFYNSKTREIIMCTEFAEYLAEIAPQ